MVYGVKDRGVWEGFKTVGITNGWFTEEFGKMQRGKREVWLKCPGTKRRTQKINQVIEWVELDN